MKDPGAFSLVTLAIQCPGSLGWASYLAFAANTNLTVWLAPMATGVFQLVLCGQTLVRVAWRWCYGVANFNTAHAIVFIGLEWACAVGSEWGWWCVGRYSFATDKFQLVSACISTCIQMLTDAVFCCLFCNWGLCGRRTQVPCARVIHVHLPAYVHVHTMTTLARFCRYCCSCALYTRCVTGDYVARPPPSPLPWLQTRAQAQTTRPTRHPQNPNR